MTLVLNGTTGVSAVDGSASTPAIQGNDSNTGMFFPAADTIAFAEGGVETMRLDSAGNVGIGTSSPLTMLNLSRDSGLSSGTGTTIAVRLTDTGSDGGANTWNTSQQFTAVQFFSSDGSGVGAAVRASVGATMEATNGSSSALTFFTNSSGTPAERARIDSSGNLLVGTTSAAQNTSGLKVLAAGSGRGITYGASGTADVDFSEFYRNTEGSLTRVGYIRTNGSSTTYSTSSDYRLKENVQPMTGALAKVAALNPVTYTWKATGENSQGFIAHELQAVVPDCVTGEKDAVDAEGNPIYQGVDTSFLVATLTAALQEAHGLIKDLQARVEVLEAK
jgi:hypothetical protein